MSTLVLDSMDAFGEVEKDRKPPVVGTTDTAVGINRHHQHPAFMFDESCDELLDGVWDSDFSEVKELFSVFCTRQVSETRDNDLCTGRIPGSNFWQGKFLL